jgi:hypothetical protein
MKKTHPSVVLLGCLLAVLPVLSPAVSAAEDARAYPADEGGRAAEDVFWTIPPINRQWERPARTQHWTLPSTTRRWNNPQGPLRWTIPRSADDMQ